MTANEKDYSEYIQHMSTYCGAYSVYVGFIFTILTLLITLLPDPSTIMSQLTLFFLTVLFDLVVFLVAWNAIYNVYLCRNVPPLTKRLAIINWLSIFSYSLSGIALTLMFLIWNLNYLALASTVVWTLVIIASFVFIYRPLLKYRETRARILRRVEKKEK